MADIVSKKSSSYIGSKCKWHSINIIIKMSVLNIIHRIIYRKIPEPLYGLYKCNIRKSANIFYNYVPISVKFRKFYIYQGIKAYNLLPSNGKELSPWKFKIKTKS